MAEELVLYTNPRSRGRIARWMLEEVEQPYRTEVLDYGTTMKAPAYLAINPMGKVPALTHGDAVVTEAAAICAYLADAFPKAGMAPPPGDRHARTLLSLAVLRRGPDRGFREQQGVRLRGAAGTASLDRIRQFRTGHESARRRGVRRAITCSAKSSAPPTSMSARRSASA